MAEQVKRAKISLWYTREKIFAELNLNNRGLIFIFRVLMEFSEQDLPICPTSALPDKDAKKNFTSLVRS